MLYLALILLLTFLVLAALLWGGTRLVQGALYEEPLTDLYWRAPAAAGALTAYIAVWALLNYAGAEPGQTDLAYDNIFNFTSEKLSERPVSEFVALRGKEQVVFRRNDKPGAVAGQEYLSDPDRQKWTPALARDVQTIIIKEGDKQVLFIADAANARYVEEGGRRYLATEAFGRITTPRGGGALVRVLLNVLHFVAWFVCLWLLLRFQWPHALGLAAALWLVMTFVVPYIFRAAADAKAARPAAASASGGSSFTVEGPRLT